MKDHDPFVVLQISSSSSEAEIRRAWRDRARTAHPDAGGSDSAMQDLNVALRSALTLLTSEKGEVVKTKIRSGRQERDVSSFTVQAPIAKTFEALFVLAGMSGAISSEEPPHQIEFSLHDSGVDGTLQAWCRCDLVSEAGATTVSLMVGTYDSGVQVVSEEVRDYLVASLNSIDWPD